VPREIFAIGDFLTEDQTQDFPDFSPNGPSGVSQTRVPLYGTKGARFRAGAKV